MLKEMGYEVTCVSNSREAVEAVKNRLALNEQFKAIILDLTIPGEPGGKDVVHDVKKLDVDVPVFVVSGYAEDPVMANPQKFGFNGSLSKPFRMNELSDLLNRYLVAD
jgi:CheY-like chemotaxis protein